MSVLRENKRSIRVEDLNNVYLRYREQGLLNYIRSETSRATLDIYRLYDSQNNYIAGNIKSEPSDIKVKEDGWIEFSYLVNENGIEKIYYGSTCKEKRTQTYT